MLRFLAQNFLKTDQSFDVLPLLETNIVRFKKHVSNEYGATYQYDDRILFGYLDILYTLMDIYLERHTYEEFLELEQRHAMIFELFYECLHYVPGKSTNDTQQNKCKAKNARAAAYRLLWRLIKALKPKELSSFLEQDFWPMFKDLPRPKGFLHSPSTTSRYLFSGITNLGCICYMISILQQCYMVP